MSSTQPAGNAASNPINRNSFTSPAGVSYSGTETVDAGYNWWNSASGPSGGGHTGTGSAVAGTQPQNIDVNPWLCVGTDVGGDPTDGFQPDLSQVCTDGLVISGAASTNEGSLIRHAARTTAILILAPSPVGTSIGVMAMRKTSREHQAPPRTPTPTVRTTTRSARPQPTAPIRSWSPTLSQ